MHVQLLTAKSIRDAAIDLDDLRPDDVAIEGVRMFEIAHRDYYMIDAHDRTIRGVSGIATCRRWVVE